MSTPTQTSQTTTIEITLNREQQELLEQAATLWGLSLSEYLLQVALNLAEEVQLKPERLVLSEANWEIVTSAIENPPELNSKLKAAIARYRQEYKRK
ncbi:MAG: DUF1778 domain-containing protein [Oscillatoriaceae cyanobacterium Prado104]|jgi:uncharacterized protein (DUF1778 family)|nr:DUF1778 domain-containing protein [Oscillatoriaceae cyanobacterium Prado104]